MKILIYLAHPSQYHFFKNIMKRLMATGHEIKLIIKTKDILETLVNEDGWIYENILPGKNGKGFFQLTWSLLKRDIKLYRISRQFKPDILIGSDASVTQVGWLLNKPRLVVGEDDYHIVKKLHWLMMPFATAVLVPEVCQLGPFEKKKIAFNSFIKLAYLHPDEFKPDRNIVDTQSLVCPYCLVRMVNLGAHHDNNMQGLNIEMFEKLTTY
jgi:predicted glycosyltransferase